jgi:hypothetical protein
MWRPVIILRKLFKGFLSREDGNVFENGVYIWRDGIFERITIYGELFRTSGSYLVYFHNNRCPHCRRFYPLFSSVLEDLNVFLKRILIVRVVCDWFVSKCKDPAALKLFSDFRVSESPKLIYVRVGADGSRKVLDLSEDHSIFRSPERLRRALLNLLREETEVLEHEGD